MGNNSGAIKLRVLTGLGLVATVACLAWIPVLAFGFALFVALLAALGTGEYYALAKVKGVQSETAAGMLASALMAVAAYWGNLHHLLLVFFVSLGLITAVHIVRGRHSLAAITSSVFGIVYVGFAGAHLVLLHRFAQDGAALITLLVVAVAFSDSGAYFVGSTIGRHKLAPTVSPNKTREGAVGGVVTAGIGCVVFGLVLAHWDLRMIAPNSGWQLACVGMLLAITSQVGDLMASMLKRDAGVKDFGTIFPGHGGVLDRCDGFLFAAPTLYYMLMLYPTLQ